MRTQRTEVHEAGEGDDPEVLGVDHVATIKLKKELGLDIWANVASSRELTKSPSANQLFRKNRTMGITKSASGAMDDRYPYGPGDSTPSVPEKS